MKIFLDTEFTNFDNPELISIGLVDENDRKFYGEFNDYTLDECSQFVKEIVIPLLGYSIETVVGNSEKIFSELDHWFEEYNKIDIMIDFLGDWYLIRDKLNEESIDKISVWEFAPDYFLESECRRKYGYPAHHALYDAIVNKYACRAEII